MAQPCDEPTLRRPDWQEGVAIVLANGQSWAFRRPRIQAALKVIDGRIQLRSHFPQYADELQALLDSTEPAADFPLIGHMALILLSENYDLANEHIPQLFVVDGSDPGLVALVAAIVPKVSTVGSEPEPGPTV